MVVWIVEGLAFEHGAGDGEEPIGDRPQRPAVGVAAGSERDVSDAARGIVLDGDAGPMVDGAAQTHVAGFAHDDDAALAASAGHGRDAGQASEGVVVSVVQRPGRFCEQRGDPCLYAVRRTLLAPGHQAYDPELLHDVGKRRTRMRA